MPHEYLERYERWMQSVRYSPKTIAQRLRMAEAILQRWPDPSTATAAGVTEWLGRRRHKSPWTAATYHSAVVAFFRWLYRSGAIEADPTDSDLVVRPKARHGKPKPLSPAEEVRALAYAHGNMRAWLLLALRAGLRAAEIASFRGEYIAEDFIVLFGKGEKEASIPTHPELWLLAQDYPRVGWWFPSPAHEGHVSANSVTILVGKHFRRPEVGIPRGSVHRCRHSFATKLLRGGSDLRQVQELMRHESPTTTAIYTAVDEDDLRAAINRLT